jgi:tetratricopeptide (TPR) repeat protein
VRRGRAVPAVLLGIGLIAAVAAASEQDDLVAHLHAGSPAERRAAAERLGEIGDQAAADELRQALRDPDEGVRGEASDAMWAIWHRSGRPEIDALLRQGTVAMAEQRYTDAVALFDQVIARAPDFAEGWNKRATVYYLMGDWDRSLADCEAVIRRNPIHFGALSGFGLNYLQKDDLVHAAEYFEKALDVNPNLAQVAATLEQIRAVLQQRRRQSI